jgi:hypothetical protein
MAAQAQRRAIVRGRYAHVAMRSRARKREPGPAYSSRAGEAGSLRASQCSGMGTMKLPRRQFLHLAAGAAALPFARQVAWAQAYPTRPITLIVPFAAGGGADVVMRIIVSTARLHCALAVTCLPKKSGPLRELFRCGRPHVSKLSEREVSRRDHCQAKYGRAGGLRHALPPVDQDRRVGRGGCGSHDVCLWKGTGADDGLNGRRSLERAV